MRICLLLVRSGEHVTSDHQLSPVSACSTRMLAYFDTHSEQLVLSVGWCQYAHSVVVGVRQNASACQHIQVHDRCPHMCSKSSDNSGCSLSSGNLSQCDRSACKAGSRLVGAKSPFGGCCVGN
ncbi:unnamed protein product [Dicrocoelium dendriticum]|nr:unnamed protein product [Dicrocoelium dendriticum]